MLILFIVLSSSKTCAKDKINEEELKAIFIKNLVKYINWPASKDSKNIKICIMGNDPIFTHFKDVTIEIKDKNSYLNDCHMVYFGSAFENAKLILIKTKGEPILTISTQNNFIENSGILQFNIMGSQVILKVNKEALIESNIEISPTLLEMVQAF